MDREEKDVYIPKGNFMSCFRQTETCKSISEYFPPDSIFVSDDEDVEADDSVTKPLTPNTPHHQGPENFVFSGNEGKEEESINNYLFQNSTFISDDEVNAEKKSEAKPLTPKSPCKNVKFWNLEKDPESAPVSGNEGNSETSINRYFSENSIFLSDEEASEEGEESLTEPLTPKSPCRNVHFGSLGKDLENTSCRNEEENFSKTPTITFEEYNNDNDYSSDKNISDGPIPLPKKNRHLLMLSRGEEGIFWGSESDVHKTSPRKGSCPVYIGSWARDLLYQKYHENLASEGLECSVEYEVASSIASKERITRNKNGLFPVFQNGIFLSVSDPEIDKARLLKKRDSRLYHERTPHERHAFDLRSTKDEVWPTRKESRSAAFPLYRKSKSVFFQWVGKFCVPPECSNVSSMVAYERGQCWVASDVSESVLLYDRAGNLLDSVNVGCPVDSLTLDKDGNMFVSCPDLREVRIVDRNRHVCSFFLNFISDNKTKKGMDGWMDGLFICRSVEIFFTHIGRSILLVKGCKCRLMLSTYDF
jgi:hypothetical protein